MTLRRRDFLKLIASAGLSAAMASSLLALMGCDTGPAETAPVPPPPSSGTPVPPPPPPTTTSGVQPETSTATTPPTAPAPGETKDRPTPPAGDAPAPYLSVARGTDPAAITRAAVERLGGISRFVPDGSDVIIKPNICVGSHTYEYAATTNPEVVGTLVSLCLAAGARRVRVLDQPFSGTGAQAYQRSGIGEAVEKAGGQMELMSAMKYTDFNIPGGVDLKKWSVYRDVIDTDVLINVPIAKHHGLARLTLSLKNLMGLVEKPNRFHVNLGQRVADLYSLLRPQLTVVDAVRILTDHGPTGGDLNDVKLTNTVIASHDGVAADSYASTLFGLTGQDIPYLRAAAAMGLGTTDLTGVKVEEFDL